jgi:hypothetical protein
MRNDIWESTISINADFEGELTALGCPAEYLHQKFQCPKDLPVDHPGFDESVKRDRSLLPKTSDREGYYGDNHIAYWASGLRDYQILTDLARKHDVQIRDYFDFGCASGRVIRHFAAQHTSINRILGGRHKSSAHKMD